MKCIADVHKYIIHMTAIIVEMFKRYFEIEFPRGRCARAPLHYTAQRFHSIKTAVSLFTIRTSYHTLQP